MRRNSKLWWATILSSSVVTGGGSFVLLTVFTDLPIEFVVKISVVTILVGDVVLALFMEAVSPTHVKLGPGERRYDAELPMEPGTVVSDFKDRCGRVAIRGETWLARQSSSCGGRLEAGTAVRVIEREGLTLVVTATEQQ